MRIEQYKMQICPLKMDINQSTSMSNVFDEFNTLYQQLGQPAAADDIDVDEHLHNATKIRTYSAAKNELVNKQLSVQQLSDHAVVGQLTDAEFAEKLTSNLEAATTILNSFVDHRDTLMMRFKDINAKQTLPIEREYQQEFSDLVMSAGSHASVGLGTQDLAWAAHFCEPPRAWEQHLAPLAALQETCKLYNKQLIQMATALNAVRKRPAQQ